MDVPDRIERQATLSAPVDRAWRAVGDAREFGAWFGVAFDGPFVAGQRLSGRMMPTTVDPEVARLQVPFAGKPFDVAVERIEAPRLLSFRWHPFAIDPALDYSQETSTLVELELTAVAGGTLLRITESGFSRIPLERRAKAFEANQVGWEHQLRLVSLYLKGHPA